MEINKTEQISPEEKDDIYEVQEIVGVKKEGVSIYLRSVFHKLMSQKLYAKQCMCI
jgi:hypothetical protein